MRDVVLPGDDSRRLPLSLKSLTTPAAEDFLAEREERSMSVFNVVRFRVRPGHDDAFLAAHRDGRAKWPGLQRGTIIKTGDGTYCLIGEWSGPEVLAAARAAMIATLDTFRDTLDDLGNGLGVTDAVSGPVVVELTE